MSSSVAATSAAFAPSPRAARRTARVRTRRIAWLEIAALIAITVALVVALVTGVSHVQDTGASAVVHVERGTTLWSLATQHPVAGMTTEQVAEQIARINHLDGDSLALGSKVRVPIDVETDLMLASR